MLSHTLFSDRYTFTRRFVLNQCHQYEQSMQQRLLESKALKPAAVMLAITERNNALSLLLTRRASHLKHHAGQICFPGGRVDNGDKDAIATACREMEEEIGVTACRSDILGQLSPIPSRSGYYVTPIVGFVDSRYKATLNTNEVSDLFELPLSHLLQPQAIRTQSFTKKGKRYTLYATHYQDYFIWGMTAHILFALQQQLIFN